MIITPWKIWNELYTVEDFIMYGARILVSAALRIRILLQLHDGHLGSEVTQQWARQTFWPGINADITSTVETCEPCQTLKPSLQKEPLLNDDNPMRSFASVSADFFVVTWKPFLVFIDRLSGWHVVIPCRSNTTCATTTRYFSHYLRETYRSPQYTSNEFWWFMV